ncbi:1,4-dihydroxy-2-naphthoate octaprenyltransferase [Thalassobius vesicularis]|uniref:1,4-dihydroxy-2-naphthoate octaprenyltransferase n=1 Tax=Thalassobius vesicularis TaxID=1294297 RepID=A0A4S3MCF7_9RHOB|nr:1,4-dihydroxy-2-naphthoate octaprenyltransferase [Thalassobius vesicularis]THD74701.1 1,4-dihydroxy-2-naphthoate octaprenyltransferase [Thalassobius vesicularis]
MTATQTRSRLAALPKPALWIIAARFKTVSLSLMPVLAGSWLAAGQGTWRVDVSLAAMLAAAAIQVGTNLWNDAADAASGVDRDDRLGPPRMTALGLLDGASVRRGALAAFGIAVLAGLYLVALGGWPIIAIGLASLAFGYLYSMGPFPMSGLPFGELLVILFFGLVAVSGTAYLQDVDPLAPQTLALGLVIGLPAAAVLMLNNHRDRAQDARAGRRTLAILLGQTGARMVYFGLLLGALALAGAMWPGWTLLPAGALALWLGHAMWHWPVSARLNSLLAQTAGFQMLLLAGVVTAG